MNEAIVIGAGHNGLTAGAYLAKAGLDVTVVERRATIGGLASTVEFAPGFHASRGPDLAGLLADEVAQELGLERHGLELVELDPLVYAPEPDGPGLALWRDPSRAVDEIRSRSARDADRYPRFLEMIGRLTGFVRSMAAKPPLTPDIRTGADLMEALRLGFGFRGLGREGMHDLLRILPMAVSDLLDEWFEDDLLKAALMGPALEGVCLGPRSAGTAALFLYQRLQDRARLPVGGSGAVSKALARALEENGGRVRTGATVQSIDVVDGIARGVTLEGGERLEAPLVLSAVAPATTLLELADPGLLDPGLVSELTLIRYRGVTAKMNLALSRAPSLLGRSSDDAHLRGPLHFGPSPDDLERAYACAKYERDSDRPFMQGVIPTLRDRSLAPEGSHVMSLLVQYIPYRATEDDEVDESRAERILDELSVYAPDTRSAIVGFALESPRDLARELRLPEGSFHHGEMAMDQMLFMRPTPGWAQYETPHEGLYLCGPGCHPGGGLTGHPGRNGARRALSLR